MCEDQSTQITDYHSLIKSLLGILGLGHLIQKFKMAHGLHTQMNTVNIGSAKAKYRYNGCITEEFDLTLNSLNTNDPAK